MLELMPFMMMMVVVVIDDLMIVAMVLVVGGAGLGSCGCGRLAGLTTHVDTVETALLRREMVV